MAEMERSERASQRLEKVNSFQQKDSIDVIESKNHGHSSHDRSLNLV